ncbi:MAG: uracil phosphoribosyltransferase [Planctomycetaceae bacterium]|nr:uracil phosphoribosyltransferase [Planctomycetaceae bacterium]
MSGETVKASEVQHPLMRHHVSRLRDVATQPEEFRSCVRRLAELLAYEATQDLALEPLEVTTPLTAMTGSKLAQRIALVPILRAGLGMVEPILDLIPSSEVWHLGLYRDEATAQPVEYYSKLPESEPSDVALVLDPMLATGGSACAALSALQRWGVERCQVLSIIAAPEGIEEVSRLFPDVSIHVCAIDEQLNANKFIVPGLGDAGDRIFNTQR